MTTWLLRRLMQAAVLVVALAMTVIVFVGVNVIGDPGRDPDLARGRPGRAHSCGRGARPRQAAVAAIPLLPVGRAARRPGSQLRLQRACVAPDHRAHARDDGTRSHRGAALDRTWHPPRSVRRLVSEFAAWPQRHGRQHPGIFAAQLLGRPDADHGVRRATRLAALHRPRSDVTAVRRAMVVSDPRRIGAHGDACAQSVASAISRWCCA